MYNSSTIKNQSMKDVTSQEILQEVFFENHTKKNDNSVLKTESSRISNDEKEYLIGFSSPYDKSGLSKFNLFIAFLLLMLILSIFIPKIYVSNNIYYLSRDIMKLQAEQELLYEEKQRLQHSIELIKNKHLLMEIGY